MEEIQYEPKSSFGRIAAAVLALTVGAAFIMSSMERKSIIANWRERRCDMGPLFAAFMFKPDSYTGSAGEFAQENFSFCLRQLAGAAIGIALEPASNMMGKQVEAGGVVAQLINSARSTFANLFDSFKEFFTEKIFAPFRRGIFELSRVTQYLNSSLSKLNAVILSFVYMGLTFYTTLTNSVSFVISVIILMLGIIAGLFFPMFFVLIAFIVLLTTTVSVVTEAGYGDLVKGPAEVFCFARGTQIATEDGGRNSIEQLLPGDRLLGGGVVQGMMRFNGCGAKMYRINDTLVSGAHLVHDNQQWQSVRNAKCAVETDIICPILYCPIVSNCVLYAGSGSVLTKFADWEEVDGAAADNYDKVVRRLLNCKYDRLPSLAPGFKETTPVVTKNNGLSGIQSVKIGDMVLDTDDKWTEVIGIASRTIRSDFASSSAVATDGVIYYNFTARSWDQYPNGCREGDAAEHTIYHLITSSGSFAIYLNGVVHVVRDATEVGWERIDSLTSMVLEALNG